MKINAALMLKAPRPGMVKTRLAADVGVEKATAIYRNLVEHQCEQIPRKWSCTIHFAPADAEKEMRAWLESVAPVGTLFTAQCEGDLGARMLHAVRHDLAGGAEAVVLLGGDCPELLTTELLDAVRLLPQADVVIAPATDGGYVLLALKQAHQELFEGIAWSRPSVFATTLARACQSQLKVLTTRFYTDIDTGSSYGIEGEFSRRGSPLEG